MKEFHFDKFFSHEKKDFKGLELSPSWNIQKDSLDKYIIGVFNASIFNVNKFKDLEFKNEFDSLDDAKKSMNEISKKLGLDKTSLKVVKVTVSTEFVE